MGALTDWLTSTKPTAAIGNWITEKLAPIALEVLEPLEKPMMAADKFFETVVRDPIGTANIKAAYAARGEKIPIKEAYKATDRISYGEAVQYNLWQTSLRPARAAIGQVVERIGGKKAVEKTYDFLPLLNPDYDLLDESQRLDAQDSGFYQLVTGLTDLGLEVFIGGKGVGAATRAVKIKTGLQRNLKKPQEVLDQLEIETDAGLLDIQKQLDSGIDIDNVTAINGITQDIINATKVTDPIEALKIPSIYNSSNPGFLSQLVSAARTPKEAADIILTEFGSQKALQNLRAEAPAFADSIELSKTPVNFQTALEIDATEYTFKVLDLAEEQKFVSVLDDIIKRNPNLSNNYQNWYTLKEGGAGSNTWAPAKFAFLEKLNTGITGWKVDRLRGYVGGIDEVTLGGGLVRPFRLLTLAALRLKPRGYVDFTGPRLLDSLEELSATILSNRLIRKELEIDGIKTSDFRTQQLNIWNSAVDEGSKDLSLAQIEINLAKRMSETIAKELNSPGVLDFLEPLTRLQARRDNLVNKARTTETGMIAEDIGSAEPLAINETLKFKLQSSKPMLDLNLLEREMRAQYGASMGTMARAQLSRIPAAFDVFERAFSAAVLIRPGYIPKNSIFEPFMRILGMTHAVSLPKMYGDNVVVTDVLDDITGEVLSKRLDVTAPNTIGGTALLEEINPAATLANVTNPKAAIDVKAKSLSEVRVNPADTAQKGLLKDYWATYARRVQQLRNDPLAGRIMAGAKDQQVLAYMMRDLNARGRFSDFYRLAAIKFASNGNLKPGQVLTAADLNSTLALELIQDARKEVFSYIPDSALQKAILDMADVFTVKSAQQMTKGLKLPTLNIKTDKLPGLDRPGEQISKTAQKAINLGFRAISSPEINLFRNQFARYHGNMMVQQMVDSFKSKGITITTELWQNTIRPVAQQYALKQTEQTFYAIRRMNNVQYYSRFLLGFPTAMFNSVKFWVRQGYNNPYNFALLEQLRTSPWAVGMVVDEDGNKISPEEARTGNKSAYLVLPFFNKPDLKDQPFITKMNVDQLNFLVNGPAPNWLGQASINTIVQATPNLETTLKDFMGEKAYNRIIYGGVPRGIIPESNELQGKAATDILAAFGINLVEQTFIPGSVSSLSQFIKTQISGQDLKFSSDSVASTLWTIHTAKRIDWELNNPDSPEPSLEQSIKETQEFMAWRFATRFLSPFGITQQPTTILYRNEFDRIELEYINNPELLADKPGIAPYQAAAQDFIALYGNEAMRALVSGTKFRTAIAPQQESARRLKDYKWLEQFVGDAPESRLPIVGMVLNPVIPGEYSPAASAYLRTQDIAGEPLGLGRKTFAEREREALEKEGWREYDRIIKKRDAALAGRKYKSITAKSNNDIRQEYLADINLLNSKNDAWEEAFGNSANTFPESVNLIRTALNNKEFLSDISRFDAEKQLWTTIAVWIQERDRLFPEWQTAKIGSKKRERLKKEYENTLLVLTQGNTYFSDFANRYLVGDSMADIRELLQTEEVA